MWLRAAPHSTSCESGALQHVLTCSRLPENETRVFIQPEALVPRGPQALSNLPLQVRNHFLAKGLDELFLLTIHVVNVNLLKAEVDVMLDVGNVRLQIG